MVHHRGCGLMEQPVRLCSCPSYASCSEIDRRETNQRRSGIGIGKFRAWAAPVVGPLQRGHRFHRDTAQFPGDGCHPQRGSRVEGRIAGTTRSWPRVQLTAGPESPARSPTRPSGSWLQRGVAIEMPGGCLAQGGSVLS